MPLPPSGPISMQMINVELARPATQIISLNESAVRSLAQVPAGMISLSNFYGKSAVVNNGYWFAGWNASSQAVTNGNKIQFASETFSATVSTPGLRWNAAPAIAESNLLMAGGNTSPTNASGPGTPISFSANNVLGFNYSTENWSELGTFSAPTGFANIYSGTASSDSAGYFSSSYVVTLNGGYPQNRKLSFSTYALTDIGTQSLPNNFWVRAGRGNPTHGYFVGGFRTPPTLRINTVSKLPFSTEAMANLTTSPMGNSSGAGTTASLTAAYYVNGSPPTISNVYNKIVFATDTLTFGPAARTGLNMGAANTKTNAYFRGGGYPPSQAHKNYQKLVFTTDTFSTFGSFSDSSDQSQVSGQPRSVGY